MLAAGEGALGSFELPPGSACSLQEGAGAVILDRFDEWAKPGERLIGPAALFLEGEACLTQDRLGCRHLLEAKQ